VLKDRTLPGGEADRGRRPFGQLLLRLAARRPVRAAVRAPPGDRLGTRRKSTTAAWPERPHVVVLDPFSAGLAFARRITTLGGRVTFLIDPSETEVSHSRRAESLVVPFEPSGVPWLATLRDLAANGEKLLVLPATDRGSELLVRADPPLPDNMVGFESATSSHLALMDKERADEIARRAGVRVPWTTTLASLDELEEAAAEAPWPCIVKPAMSHEWRAIYGNERVFLVADGVEARARLDAPLRRGVKMLLSQYVAGGDSDVEEAIVVRLADGSYPVRFGCRKLRQWPPGFGITAVGEASPLPETTEIAEKILDQAGFVGVAGVEVKRDPGTEERWFIEVNVRMPGQWGLGDACGADASARLVAAMLGGHLGPPPDPSWGRRMALPEFDAHVVIPALRRTPWPRRPALAWRLLRPYFGARELGMFDPRDPGPGLALARSSLRRRWRRLRARLAGGSGGA
jgi:D-aspartate ligase